MNGAWSMVCRSISTPRVWVMLATTAWVTAGVGPGRRRG